jgi:hypothetical protein
MISALNGAERLWVLCAVRPDPRAGLPRPLIADCGASISKETAQDICTVAECMPPMNVRSLYDLPGNSRPYISNMCKRMPPTIFSCVVLIMHKNLASKANAA